MTKLTRNNQLEQRSKIEFQSLTLPWESQSFDHDTGIDLIVQPYDEMEKDDDGSIPPFGRRFLVQLKSTESEHLGVDHNQGKLQIDKAHLLSWRSQNDPVMIARYYLHDECFYYEWISNITIKEEQRSQVILLPYRFDRELKDQVKENILDYLIPPNVSQLIYEPINRNSGIGYMTIDNIRRSQQVPKIIEKLEPQVNTEMRMRRRLHELKIDLVRNATDTSVRFKIIFILLQLKELNEALSELNILSNIFFSSEAKIITAIIRNNRIDLINKLSKLNFIFLLVVDEGVNVGTEIVISLDGEEYKIGEYKEFGIPLPRQDFRKIDFVRFNTQPESTTPLGKGFVSSYPIRFEYSFKLVRTLTFDGQVYSEFSEVIISDKFRVDMTSLKFI